MLEAAALVDEGQRDLPVYDAHRGGTSRDAIDVVQSWRIEGDSIVAVLRLSADDDVQPIRQRVAGLTIEANTSGIPAMFHDNETVIPLSRGRKVGVELNGGGAGGTLMNMPRTFQLNTPDADSFRRSKSHILQETGAATRKAMAKNG